MHSNVADGPRCEYKRERESEGAKVRQSPRRASAYPDCDPAGNNEKENERARRHAAQLAE